MKTPTKREISIDMMPIVIILVLLKVLGVIKISWMWVFCPIWIPLVLMLIWMVWLLVILVLAVILKFIER